MEIHVHLVSCRQTGYSEMETQPGCCVGILFPVQMHPKCFQKYQFFSSVIGNSCACSCQIITQCHVEISANGLKYMKYVNPLSCEFRLNVM